MVVEHEDEENIDAFNFELKLSTLDWIKVYVLTVLLIPIRVVGIVLVTLFGWICSRITIAGLTDDQIDNQPRTGWRKTLFMGEVYSLRATLIIAGVWPKIKGQISSKKEAPIMVCAPHTTVFDAVAPVFTTDVFVVSRVEDKNMPIFGVCQRAGQNIFVDRTDPDSKEKTRREILRRATEKDWSRMCIFSEGCCTNGRAVVRFKTGAFQPGLPVQPVLVKYPNKLDTVTWTLNMRHNALVMVWLTLAQLYTVGEVEYLPVYYPNEEEKENPRLYANNVRKVMAKALGKPLTNSTYEEARAKLKNNNEVKIKKCN